MSFLDQLMADFSPAVLAWVGAVISWVPAFYVHYQQSRAQKIAEKKEKLETLMYECLQIDAWADKQESIFLTYPVKPLPHGVSMNWPNKIEVLLKVETIVLLHFSGVTEQMRKVESAAFAFADYLLQTYVARQKLTAAQLPHPGNPPQRAPLRQKLADAQQELIDAIRELM